MKAYLVTYKDHDGATKTHETNSKQVAEEFCKQYNFTLISIREILWN